MLNTFHVFSTPRCLASAPLDQKLSNLGSGNRVWFGQFGPKKKQDLKAKTLRSQSVSVVSAKLFLLVVIRPVVVQLVGPSHH